jgi:predicted nucleic acid-binding protein
MATTNINGVFIDTNVLTRATIVTAPLHVQAQAALVQLRREQQDLWISHQVIREYLVNATRPQTYSQPIAIDQLLEQVKRFRATFRIAEDTVAVMDQLLSLLATVSLGGKQVHDANIVATMLTHGIPKLLTHNTVDFARFSAYITVLPVDATSQE